MTYLPLSESIQKYLISCSQMDWPIDWEQVFGQAGELVVEIGFGNGDFLIDLVQQHPDRLFVGIERAWGSVTRLFNRLHEGGFKNVRAMELDAAFAIAHLFGPQSLSAVYINFPDPWHKERHHRRRLIQPPFIRALAERLKLGGRVLIATDQVEYATWITEVLEGQSFLMSEYETTYVHDMPGRKPTKYEQKAIASGLPIHYFVWQLKTMLDGAGLTEKVGEMPSVILDGAFDAEGLLRDFEPMVWQEKHRGVPVVIKLMEAYGQLHDGHRLLTVMVSEGALIQHFAISVVYRNERSLLIKLADVGQPRPTWGVKQAVGKVADVIQKVNPTLKVTSSTVG
jgi:tRNA (guanine-N7-)-methyltransferase